MNIEEMQKFWDTENQRTLYTIDEKAMDKIILQKSKQANKTSKKVENIIVGINLLVPIFLLLVYGLNDKHNVGAYLSAAFMFCSAAYILIARQRRENEWKTQSETVLDHLDEAIHNATSTAKMTNLFLIWYIIGIGVLNCIMLWVDGAQWYFVLAFSLLFVIAFFVGRWEQRAWHDKRRDKLIALREKIVDSV